MDNLVHKLMTEPQPVLINVLIRAIFKHFHKVVCGGILCDHSIRQSLLSLLVNFENLSIFSKVMGKSRVSCFF